MRVGEQTIASDMPGSAWLMVYEGNNRAISVYENFSYIFIGKDYHFFEDIKISFNVMKKECGSK